MVRRARRNLPPLRVARQKPFNVRGTHLKVPSQPPEFVSRPWFALTVRLDNVGTTLTLASLLANVRTQLGWAADVPLAVRLQHVKVWSPLVGFTSTTPLTPLNVAIQDFVMENIFLSGSAANAQRILEQYTRYPDQTRRASVGYAYGMTHSAITLSGSSTIPLADVTLLNLTGAGPGSVVYYHLLFRTGTVSPANIPSANDVPDTALNRLDPEESDSEIEVLCKPQPKRATKRKD